MTTIYRKDVYLCSGDKRHIYELPEAADEEFASALSEIGTLKKMDLGDGILWIVELNDNIRISFESGNTRLDARFRKKIYQEKVKQLEDILKTYFKADIQILD
jgi:hypothetical protein